MRVDYSDIEERLERWARWRINGGGNPFPTASTFTQQQVQADSAQSRLPPGIDDEGAATDRIVCALPVRLSDVIIEEFTRLGTRSQKAARFALSPAGYDDRLTRALEAIAYHIHHGKSLYVAA